MRTPRRKYLSWFVRGSQRSTSLLEALRSCIGAERLLVLRSWDHALRESAKRGIPKAIFAESPPPPQRAAEITRLLPGTKIIGVTAHNVAEAAMGIETGEVLDFLSRRAQALKYDHGLTPSEKKVLQLMVKGFIKKEIAEQLSLSFHTVNNRERKIYGKLNVHTRPAAVAKALMEGLV